MGLRGECNAFGEELFYAFDAVAAVAHSESEVPTMTEVQKSLAAGNAGDDYWLTRCILLRLLGGVYAVAFLVAAKQILPLIGSHGLLPACFLHGFRMP